jgi:hypothetical protein
MGYQKLPMPKYFELIPFLGSYRGLLRHPPGRSIDKRAPRRVRTPAYECARREMLLCNLEDLARYHRIVHVKVDDAQVVAHYPGVERVLHHRRQELTRLAAPPTSCNRVLGTLFVLLGILDAAFDAEEPVAVIQGALAKRAHLIQ